MFSELSDLELLATVHRLAAEERHAIALLIASLAELDARRLYLGEGCSSMFTYCTQVLHLSEHAAYGRIEAARLARRFPVILEQLADGAMTLTAIGLLAPHLKAENHRELLESARHKSKREVEQLVATLRPQPSVPASVRKLPSPAAAARPVAPRTTLLDATAEADIAPTMAGTVSVPRCDLPPAGTSSAAARRAVIQPLAPERYKVQFTMDADAAAQLRRAQELMRHRVPDGDVGAIVTYALALLVERLETTKLAAAKRPRPPRETASSSASRAIPAAVRREVWARDEGRCAFVGSVGRCTETSFLEFHHVHPYAVGGRAVIENTELRCRAHNQYEAELFFGVPRPTARERSRLLDWSTD